jgi:hypothetical protein
MIGRAKNDQGMRWNFCLVFIVNKAPTISLTKFHKDQWAHAWIRGVMGVCFLGFQACWMWGYYL